LKIFTPPIDFLLAARIAMSLIFLFTLNEYTINPSCYSHSFSFNRKKVIRTGLEYEIRDCLI
jgi:hypothetical protein